jgi:site-specific recombinase XerD
MTAMSAGDAVAISQHEQHLRSLRRSRNTITRRVNLLIRLAQWLSTLDEPRTLLTATEIDLATWQEGMDRLATESVANYINHARMFYAWMIRTGHLDSSPAGLLVRPKTPRGKPRPIADADLREALVLAPPRTLRLLLLGTFLGARCMEIAAATVADLRHREPVPRALLHGKGAKERWVPMSGLLVPVLMQAGMPTHGPVVGRADGSGPLSPARVSAIINEYLHQVVGIPDTAHQLRHWYGTNVYRMSGDLLFLRDALGHVDVGTTAIYALPDPKRAGEIADGLDVTIGLMLNARTDLHIANR